MTKLLSYRPSFIINNPNMDILSGDAFVSIQQFLSIIDLYNLMLSCKYFVKILRKNIIKKVIFEIDRRLQFIFKENYDDFKMTMHNSGAIIGGSFITQCILNEHWAGSDIEIYQMQNSQLDQISDDNLKKWEETKICSINGKFKNVTLTDPEIVENPKQRTKYYSATRYTDIHLTDAELYSYTKKRGYDDIGTEDEDGNNYDEQLQLKVVYKNEPEKIFANMYAFFYHKKYKLNPIINPTRCQVQNIEIVLIYDQDIKSLIMRDKFTICQNFYQYNKIQTILHINAIDDICNRRINLNDKMNTRVVKYYDRGFSFYNIKDPIKKVLSKEDINQVLCECIFLIVDPMAYHDKKISSIFIVSDNNICHNDIPIYKICNYTFLDNYRFQSCCYHEHYCPTYLLFPNIYHMHNGNKIFIIVHRKIEVL
jgi:hypothetical protein